MDDGVREILSDLKAKRYDPVYFLQGEEVYFIDLISNYIEQNVLSDSEKSFNQVVVYGKEAPVNVILTHARRFPMMAERQVVIVKEAQEIPDLGKDTGQKLLLDYLARPVPSTILVFCHKHKNLDRRKELGKKVEQLTRPLTAKKIYDNQLPAFVKEYSRGIQYTFNDDAIEVLCESVGTDLSRMANEIDKLAIGRDKGTPITAEEVMRQVGMSREFNIFELQKAIANHDTFKIFQIAEYFAGNTKKNPLIMSLAFLYTFFSKLLVAASTSSQSERDLAIALKISPFGARDYITALRNFPLSRIIECIRLIREADLRLKGVNSGSEDEGQILKELMIRLIH